MWGEGYVIGKNIENDKRFNYNEVNMKTFNLSYNVISFVNLYGIII